MIFLKTFKKTISLLVALIFTAETVIWAAPDALTVRPAAALPGLSQLAIPESLGTIQSRFTPKSDSRFFRGQAPFIIHIQDAHAQPEAQQNIRAILDYLSQKEQVGKIAVEAAFGKIDAHQYRFLNDPAANQTMAERLTQMGELTGAELFMMNSTKGALHGVEDKRIYAESFRTFREVKSLKPEIEETLEAFEKKLEKETSRVFSKDLKLWIKTKKTWDEHHDEALDYFRTLQKLAAQYLKLDLADAANQFEWPNLTRLLKAEEVEARFNRETAAAQVRELMTVISKPQAEKSMAFLLEGLKTLTDPSQSFAAWLAAGKSFPEIKTTRRFLELLYEKAQVNKISLLNYPDFLTLGGLMILREELDSAGLLKELKLVETRLEEKIVKTEAEKELLQTVKDFSLLRKLTALEMSREEYEIYKTRKKELTIVSQPPFGLLRNDMLELAEKFYELSRTRDQILIDNTLKNAPKDKATILITGGFHSEGLTELLKSAQIPHLVITPKISRFADDNLYEKVMMGENGDSASLTAAGDKLGMVLFPLRLNPAIRSELEISNASVLRVANASAPSAYLHEFHSTHPDLFETGRSEARAPKGFKSIFSDDIDSLKTGDHLWSQATGRLQIERFDPSAEQTMLHVLRIDEDDNSLSAAAGKRTRLSAAELLEQNFYYRSTRSEARNSRHFSPRLIFNYSGHIHVMTQLKQRIMIGDLDKIELYGETIDIEDRNEGAALRVISQVQSKIFEQQRKEERKTPYYVRLWATDYSLFTVHAATPWDFDEEARLLIAQKNSVTIESSPQNEQGFNNPEFVIVDGMTEASVVSAAEEMKNGFGYTYQGVVKFEAKGNQFAGYRIVLHKEISRSEVRELTETQSKLLDEVEKVYQLSPADKVYLKGMWMQQLARMQGIEDPNKKALLIAKDRNNIREGENFILASHLSAEERVKLLGAFEYWKLFTPENAEGAKNIVLTANSMDGGIGESLARALWLGQRLAARGVISGEVKLGAKGTDLGFNIEVGERKEFVSVAEAKILQLINNAEQNKYAGIKFQPLVNYQSIKSYENLLNSPYFYDRISPAENYEAKNPRTLRQAMEAAGIEILPLLQQADLPRISLKTGDITLNQKVKRQPGGHGQWGVLFMYESFKAEIPQDGKTRMRAFYNGDNLNSAANEYIMGWMAKNRIPIVKLTTAATPIDKKGGKDGVRIIITESGALYVPDQMEETVAKNSDKTHKGQLETFYEAGQEGGNGEAGKQPFNTNVIYINDSVLSPILRDLEKAVGADEFAVIISPTLLDQTLKAIEVDGEKFIPLDGAIGNVIHNLNAYFMLNQDNPPIKAIIEKHGLKDGRLLYFVDVPRTEFFTPVKVATDMWLQAYSDYYKFNPDTMRLEDSRDGLTPPEFDLVSKGAEGKDDKHWLELQNLVDALGHASTVGLKSLTIDGKVLLRDAKLTGHVKIVNQTGNLIDLNDPSNEALERFFKSGKLTLSNVEITIQANGTISVAPYLDEDAFRESFESVDARITGMARFSGSGLFMAAASLVLALATLNWYPLFLTGTGLVIWAMFRKLSNYALNELKGYLTKSGVVLVESKVSQKEAQKIANRLKALKFADNIQALTPTFPIQAPWDVIYDSTKKTVFVYPSGMTPPGVLRRSEVRETSHDIRVELIEKLKAALGPEADNYVFYPGGFASIDIMPKGVSKQSAITDFFSQKKLDAVFYFGDEFFKSDKKTGNDTPLLTAKRVMEESGKQLILFSVDEKPEERTAEAKESTIWIGAGPAATKKVLAKIQQAIVLGQKEVTIAGQGEDAHKNITIDLQTLILHSSLVFDVDGTILAKKSDHFSNEPEIRELFAGLLNSRVPLGIISGNSKTEQKERIGDHLKTAPELKDLTAIQGLTIYVNGGATRLTYEPSGDEVSVNLAGDLSVSGIQKVAEIVGHEAVNNFGLSQKELTGWQQWFQFDGQFGMRPDFPNVKFIPWWTIQSFKPATVDAEKIKKASHLQPLELLQPFIEIRDNVQLSIKLFPKAVDIPPASTPRAEVRAGELSDPQKIDSGGRAFNFSVKRVIPGDEAKTAIAQKLSIQVKDIRSVLVTAPLEKRGKALIDSEFLQPDDLLTVTLDVVAPRSEVRAAGLEKLDGDRVNHRWWNYRLLNPMTVGEIKAALAITDPSYSIQGATVTPGIDGAKGTKALDLKSASNNEQRVPKNVLLTVSFAQASELSLQAKTKKELAADILGLLAKRDELPEKVDLIMVFGSSDPNVPAEAAKLFKQGKASKILVSGRYGLHITLGSARPESYVYREKLIELGVPSSAILIEDQSRHMRQNAEFSLKLLQDRKAVPQTAILVHTPKLQARGAQTARDVFGANTVIYDDAAYLPELPSQEAELDALLAELVKEIDSINQFAPALPSLVRLNELKFSFPRSEVRQIPVSTTDMSREQEIATLTFFLNQLKAENQKPGIGYIPVVAMISDQHGTINKFDALIVDAIRQALPEEDKAKLPAGFKLDPDKTLEEQLSQANINLDDLRKRVYFHNLGDITDRGPHGIKVFRRSKQLINAGLSDFILGNHDLWTMMNLWGMHLPWYEGFNFYGYSDSYDQANPDLRIDKLVETYRQSDPEVRTKTWWAKKLFEFTKFHEKQQKERWGSLDAEFNGNLDEKGKRIKGTGLYAQLKKEEITADQKAAWDKFRGWYEKGNIEVYTGIRAVGLVSVQWWEELLKEFEKAYANTPHAPPVERALALMRDEIIPALKTNLQVRLDRGEWWVRAFEAINSQNYASVEWWAKDWAYHKDWGTAVFEELNDELQTPDVRAELAAANEEKRKEIRKDKNKYKVEFDQSNYFESPILQRIADDYRELFFLHKRDIYQNDYMHAFLPVDEKTGEFFFKYRGTEYRGKGSDKTKSVWEGLAKIGEDVRNKQRGMKDLYDALSLVNSWYADATTIAKVPDVVKALEKFGPDKLAEVNGINRLFTGHLPFHEFSKFKKDDKSIVNTGFLLGRRFGMTDHGMGKRFGSRGASVIVSPDGIELRGFEHGEHKEIISNPRTVAVDNGAEKVLFENKGIPREQFLPQLIKEVEARLKQLAGPVALETAVSASLTKVVIALRAILDNQRGIVSAAEELLFAEVSHMIKRLTSSGVNAEDIIAAQGLLERVQKAIANRGAAPALPLPAAEPLDFRYDSERHPLLLEEPVRMAINLGHYLVDEDSGEPTRVLASNFSNKRKVAVNTVQNRVFDAYLREITGNPNVQLTDIYGVQDIRRFHVAILGQLHGRTGSKVEIEEEAGKKFLVVNGNGGKRHRIQIHSAVPTADSLKKSATQYLIDFSDPELTGELEFKNRTGRDLREERLKALQQAAGLQKVFAFGDEEPANETVVAGVNSQPILNRKDPYLPLASPVTLALEQLKKAVMIQMPADFDFAAGVLAARPVTGDSGHIQFLGNRQNGSVVEYDIEKGAGSAFVSFIPTRNSRFKAIAKQMYADIKALKNKQMSSKEREKETERIKKKVIYENFNRLIEEAAKGPLGRYLRYAGEENLNSLTAMRERFAIVFDSQATTLRENGQVDLYFHYTDFGYAAALNHLITDASRIDGTPVTPEAKDQFEAQVREGVWRTGTIPPNAALSVKKVVKDGEEIKFAIVGVRGRIGAPLHQQLLSDPNFIPSFYLGIEDIHTVLQQYKEDVTQGPRTIERPEDFYIPEAAKDNRIRFKGQKSGQYLMHPATDQPLAIPYFHIRQRDGEEDEAFERRIAETLNSLLDDVEVLINASGFAMDSKDKYYNAFLNKNLKMVLFTAPAKGEVDITTIRGVNEDDLLKKAMDAEKTLFCSGASCTTTGLARALVEYVKFLENWGVEVVEFEIHSDLEMEFAKFVTHHAITPSQGPAHGDASAGKSLRGASGPIKAANLEGTGADKVVKEVVPKFKGRSGGVSHRDGNFGGSVLDISATLHSKSGKYPTAAAINEHFQKLAQTKDLEGVLTYLPYLLSTAQIAGEKTASIFSADGTRVETGKESAVATIRVGYDNEWGYTASQVHLVKLAALGRRGLATPENIRVASSGELEYFQKFKEANTALGLRLKRDVLYSSQDLGLSEANHAAFKEILKVLSRPVLSLRFVDEIPFVLSMLDQALNDLAALGTEEDITLRDIESDLRDTQSEMIEFVKDHVTLPRKETKKVKTASNDLVEKIERLAQTDPKSPELAGLGLGLLNRYDFENFDRVSDVLLDSIIANQDFVELKKYIELVYQPIPDKLKLARRIYGIIHRLQNELAAKERAFTEAGEKIDRQTGWHYKSVIAELDKWAHIFDPEQTVSKKFDEEKDFPMPSTAKFGEERIVADELVKDFKREILKTSKDLEMLQLRPDFQARVRRFNQKLITLPFDDQSRIIGIISYAATLAMEESVPLIAYLIAQYIRYGYQVPERDMEPLLAFMDMANAAEQPSSIYLLRLLGKIIFTHQSGKALLQLNEAERAKSRQGDYKHGIHGVLRDQIHNLLGEHVLGLLERQFEYYRTGDPKILHSLEYQPNIYKGRFSVPEERDSRYPEYVVNELKPADDKAGSDFIRALQKHVMAADEKRNFYEVVRSFTDAELQTVIDKINQELGTNYNLTKDYKTAAAYLWIYRQLAGRFAMGNEDQTLSRFSGHYHSLYSLDSSWKEKEALLQEFSKDLKAGRGLAALQLLVEIKEELKESFSVSNPLYNRASFVDRFQQEFGRADVDNAEGGAIARDPKLYAYQAEFYLSQLEERLIQNLFRKFEAIGTANLEEAYDFLVLLGRIGYLNGDYSIDQLDNLETLGMAGVDPLVKQDVLNFARQEGEQKDTYFKRLLRPTIATVTDAIPLDVIRKHLAFAGIQHERLVEKEMREQSITATQRQIERMNLADFYLRQMLDKWPASKWPSRKQILKNQSYTVLGANSTPEEINDALKLGRFRLGSKGIGLVRALKRGIPVPPFAIIANDVKPEVLEPLMPYILKELDKAIKGENNMGLGSHFAAGERPYYLSARASTYFVAPGQYLTFTNLGMKREQVPALAKRMAMYGLPADDARWTAWDSYRRFLEDLALGAFPEHFSKMDFHKIMENFKIQAKIAAKEDLTGAQMEAVASLYETHILSKVAPEALQDATATSQIATAIDAIHASFSRAKDYHKAKNIQGKWPEPAVILQAMTYGNIKSQSGVGIIYTRDPNTWQNGINGDYKFFAQGRDLADSSTIPLRFELLFSGMPWQNKIARWGRSMEQDAQGAVEMEVTVQMLNGEPHPWLLQVRTPSLSEPVPAFEKEPDVSQTILKPGQAIGASGGAYRGIVIYDTQHIPTPEKIRRLGVDGVILITELLSPEDVASLVLQDVRAVISRVGGYASHTADIARDLEMTAITSTKSLTYDKTAQVWKIGNVEINEGDIISIDGRTGAVYQGILPLAKSEESAQLRSELRFSNEAQFREVESQIEQEAVAAGRLWNAVRFVIQVAHGFVPVDLMTASSTIAAYFKQVFGPAEALANMLESSIPAETQALVTRVQNLESAARKNLAGTSTFERRLVVLAAYEKQIPKLSAEDLKAMLPGGGTIVLQDSGLEKNLRRRYEKVVRELIRKSEVRIELKTEVSHYAQPTVEGFEMLAAKYRGHVPVFVLPQSYEGNLSQLEGISNQAFVLTPSRTKAARYALSYLAGHMTPAALRKQVPDGLSVSYRDEKSAVTMHVTNEARFAAFELSFAAERLLASAA